MIGEGSDSRHSAEYIYFHGLNSLLHRQRFFNVNIPVAAFVGADDPVGFALAEKLNCQEAHLRSIDAITAGGSTASLDMAENGNAGIQVDGLFDLLGDICRRAGAFRHDDHVVGETVKSGLADLFDNILFEI